MKNIFHITLYLCLCGTFLPAQKTISLFEQLSTADGAEITLSTNLTTLIKNKNTSEYQPAVLQAPDGKMYPMTVKPRGKFRRRIAEIPPLKLKIKKKLLQEKGLIDSLNELKLVLPTSLDEEGNDLVIREYLVYRMFEKISPYATRARLINLTLVNTDTRNKKIARFEMKAILLEDEEELEARFGGKIFEAFGLALDSLQTEQAALTVQFQYMIGNTDWSIAENRNLRFLKLPSGENMVIPYDFDFSGFVSAPYSSPKAGVGLQTVRDRYLMAEGLPPEALRSAAQIISQEQVSFRTICQSGLLTDRSTQSVLDYLNLYFLDESR